MTLIRNDWPLQISCSYLVLNMRKYTCPIEFSERPIHFSNVPVIIIFTIYASGPDNVDPYWLQRADPGESVILTDCSSMVTDGGVF